MNEFTLNTIYCKCRNISPEASFIIYVGGEIKEYTCMEKVPFEYWFDTIVDYFKTTDDLVEVWLDVEVK